MGLTCSSICLISADTLISWKSLKPRWSFHIAYLCFVSKIISKVNEYRILGWQLLRTWPFFEQFILNVNSLEKHFISPSFSAFTRCCMVMCLWSLMPYRGMSLFLLPHKKTPSGANTGSCLMCLSFPCNESKLFTVTALERRRGRSWWGIQVLGCCSVHTEGKRAPGCLPVWAGWWILAPLVEGHVLLACSIAFWQAVSAFWWLSQWSLDPCQ